jgi:hypothetical protein
MCSFFALGTQFRHALDVNNGALYRFMRAQAAWFGIGTDNCGRQVAPPEKPELGRKMDKFARK